MPAIHGKPAVSWWGATAPPTFVSLGAATYIGVGFQITVAGRIMGMRLYLEGGWGNSKWGLLWDQDAIALQRVARFRMDGADPGTVWRQAWFRPWFRPTIGTNYRIAVMMANAYGRHNTQLASPVTNNGLKFISSFQSTAINPVVVSITTNTNANGVDVLFQAD